MSLRSPQMIFSLETIWWREEGIKVSDPFLYFDKPNFHAVGRRDFTPAMVIQCGKAQTFLQVEIQCDKGWNFLMEVTQYDRELGFQGRFVQQWWTQRYLSLGSLKPLKAFDKLLKKEFQQMFRFAKAKICPCRWCCSCERHSNTESADTLVAVRLVSKQHRYAVVVN